MPVRTWVLSDVEQNTYHGSLELGQGDVPEGCSVRKRTLRGGKQDGVEVVEVDNGAIRVTVVPTRGMGVWKATCGDRSLGWRSPVRGPVHPRYVPVVEPSGLGWLDGFDELLVRCGLESNGAPEFETNGALKYPLHGRIANLPAHRVTVSADSETGEISVTGIVEEARFHFLKLRLTATISTWPGQAGFHVHDTVENFSAVEAQMQLLYHVNFGLPLLDAGARLVAPVKTLVPRNEHAATGVKDWDRYPAPQPGSAEQVYFFELLSDEQGRTEVLLANSARTEGVSLRYPQQQLPCFAQWKNPAAAADGYVTGLEPATNFPNPRSFEGKQGRTVQLPPGGKRNFDLEVAWHLSPQAVVAAEQQVRAIQAGHSPEIQDRPLPDWCS